MKRIFILCFTLLGLLRGLAQTPGDLDTTFNSVDIGFGNGDGASSTVYPIVLQPDGKVLIGGGFTTYNGTSRNRIARLNADGSLDASFNPGSGASNDVEFIVLQPDGKVLIGGLFTSYNGTSRNRIARLNADGSLDASFNQGSGANSHVYSMALQPDGKVLIGGNFTSYNGTPINRIARLNADGSLDASFNPGSGASSNVYSIALQPDGKVLIGGSFTSYNGTSRNRIARLNADGSLDASFNPGTGANSDVVSIALQPDGKVLIGGYFTSYNGTSRDRIARLNADGSLDASFNPGTGASSTVSDIALQPDGKVLIGGEFTSYNGTSRNRIARLNADGSLDASFNPGTGANNDVNSMALQPDGKVLIGGWFTSYNGTPLNRIACLNADGSLDASFNPGSGANNWVYSMALQPDGKVLIGGWFTSYNGTSRNYIARLNADGSLDASFNPGSGANSHVYSMALQPDGKVLIGGWFTSYNGTPRNYIARLNADGSLDASFNPGTGANSDVNSMALQPDGKVLIGGLFTSYNGTSRNRIARLNADGSLDASFNPGTGAGGWVESIALQPDGKVLIGGNFIFYNGTPRSRIARLNADGSLDVTFDPGLGANVVNPGSAVPIVRHIALQPDGKVLIGGLFGSYNGTSRNHIARLNADGSLDASFNPGSGANNWLESMALQPDGKVLIGGLFTSYNGTPRNYIARLNADGSLDASFNPGVGANSYVYSMALQPDGKVLIGGWFTSYNGIGRNRIARIHGASTSLVCNPHNLSSVAGSSGHYNQRFNWTAITGTSEHRLQYRMVGNSSWSGVNEVGTQRLIQNLAPGDYEARVYGVGLGDTSCLLTFTIGCATNISYATNVFQAAYLNALPASSAIVTVFNVSGGKSLYNFELENLSTGNINRVDARRNQTYSQLTGGSYVLRVYDAYNCQADSVTPITIDALDTAYIPNLISAVNSSPNGFRPIWNRPRQNGVLMPGILSYQLRVRNETDNQLVSQLIGITDTFVHVNNLTPGKLYRFNVRSNYNPGSGARNSAYSIRRDRILGAGGNKEEGGGVEEPDAVRIYPNPTADLVFVESPLGSHIKLLDLQGRIMQSLMAEGPISSLDLSPYAQGTYLLEINIQGQMHHQKVVKQ